MENYRYMLAVIQKLQSLKVEKMGQILCVKKVPFRKSGHICSYTLLLSVNNSLIQFVSCNNYLPNKLLFGFLVL